MVKFGFVIEDFGLIEIRVEHRGNRSFRELAVVLDGDAVVSPLLQNQLNEIALAKERVGRQRRAGYVEVTEKILSLGVFVFLHVDHEVSEERFCLRIKEVEQKHRTAGLVAGGADSLSVDAHHMAAHVAEHRLGQFERKLEPFLGL